MQSPTFDQSIGYYLKEHSALRDEINELIKDARSLERWVLISIGGILIWLFSNQQLADKFLAFWVPAGLCLFCGIRVFFYQINLKHAVAYSMKLEKLFCTIDGLEGWNHYVENARSQKWCKYSIPSIVFWSALTGIMVIFACFH
jgi:hypothetical protein